MPPQGPYAQQGPPPGMPQQPVTEEEPAAKGKSAMPWMLATVVAAALAIGAAAWGFTQKSDAQNAAQTSQADIASLQAQIDEGKKQDEALQQQLDAAKAQYQKVEERYQTKKKDLQNQTAQLDDLEKQYNQARQDAQAKAATAKDQLQAAQSKAELATKCAQVIASGMRVIYDADDPSQVMDDVVKEMEKASASCDGVVSTG
ncbi:MAG: hypothetical protein V9G10_08320 [Candidatus Nanopelagicales bacterium]